MTSGSRALAEQGGSKKQVASLRYVHTHETVCSSMSSLCIEGGALPSGRVQSLVPNKL